MFKDLYSKYKPAILSLGYVLLTVAIFVVSQFVGLVLAVTAFQIAGYQTEEIRALVDESSFAQFFTLVVINIALVSLIYSLDTSKNFFKSIGFKKSYSKETAITVAKAAGIYFASMIIVVAFIDLFVPAVDVDQRQQIGFENASSQGYIFAIISLIVLVPIVEEMLFRGFLLQKLKKIIKPEYAIVVTSIVFSVAHLELALQNSNPNWIAAIDTFVLSLLLGWVFIKTKNLWASVALHALKNTIGFIFIFIIS